MKDVSEPVIQEVRLTVHGPILNDVEKRLAEAPLMSLNWTAIAGADRTFEAILGLNTAGSFEEFRREPLRCTARRARTSSMPTWTATSATSCPARSRSATATRPALRPRPRRRRRTRMDGQHPVRRAPSLLDPEAGTIVTANNAIVDASYRYYLADHWDPGFRAEQAADGLLARGEDGLTLDDMTELQVDTTVGRARNAAGLADGGRAHDRRRPARARADPRLGRRLRGDGLGCTASSMLRVPAAPRRLRRRSRAAGTGLRRDPAGPDADRRTVRRGRRRPGGTTRRAPNRETSSEIVARALDEAGSALATAYRRLDQLDLGPRAHRDLPGGDDRRQRDRPAGVVLQRRPARGRRGLRSARQHLLPVLACLP